MCEYGGLLERHEIAEYIAEGNKARANLEEDKLYELGMEIGSRMLSGKKLILMGNGGSAADAQHIAAEFVGRFKKERRAFPALALSTNTSVLTAIGNDYSYDKIFERQIEAMASSGDIVIGISTSGNSPNVINALRKAAEVGCTTVAMTGRSGGALIGVAQIMLKVDSEETPIIQEAHIAMGHLLSKIAEDIL